MSTRPACRAHEGVRREEGEGLSVRGKPASRMRLKAARREVDASTANIEVIGESSRHPTLFPQTPEVLQRLIHLLVAGGQLPSVLAREFAAACQRIKVNHNVRRPATGSPLEHARIAHILSHWYSDPQYLDSEGVPRALTLSGRRQSSLTSLIGKVLPQARPSAIVRSLERLGAVHRVNHQYRPTGHYVYFGRQRV